MKKIIFLLVFSLLNSFNLYSAEEVEEVVIIGSQIKGAKITGALPVTVISSGLNCLSFYPAHIQRVLLTGVC